jgi:hypothetical protein
MVMYFVIRGGFLASATGTAELNPWGFVAVAALVGLFSKQATNKLDELFSTMFKTDKERELRDKLQPRTNNTTFVPILLLALFAAGCASRASRQGETTMPSPDGCFVQVWDLVRFGGVTDYINGPRVYANLLDLPRAVSGAIESEVRRPAWRPVPRSMRMKTSVSRRFRGESS